MKRRTHQFRPETTPLEAKALLSVGAPTPEVDRMAILSVGTAPPADGQAAITEVRSGTTPATAITNTVRGRYLVPATDSRIADAPLRVRLAGAGSVDGLGRAALTGQLDLGGFRVAGTPDVTGSLTLVNARGTVKLQLAGTGGFQEVPNGRFVTDVTVTRSTGAYRGFQRTGTATLNFGPNTLRALHGVAPLGGTVTVTLALKPLVK